jgi:hypothetical protein
MKDIPFFYHDLKTRIVPGALFLVMFGLLGLKVPAPFLGWFSGPEAWKAVAVPLLIVFSAYIIGDAIEALTRETWNPLGRIGLRWAAKKQKVILPADEDQYRYDIWNWIVMTVSKDHRDSFLHVHRFQGEAKMFLNMAVPAAYISRFLIVKWSGNGGWVTFTLIFVGCSFLSLLCEKRRWIQVLATHRQLTKDSAVPEQLPARAASGSK